MTIHKSKGLEFPYVFILNMDQTSISKTACLMLPQSSEWACVKYIAKVETGAVEAATILKPLNSIPSLTYTQNEKELQLASYSEQMCLLYVAMTRAEKSSILSGKGSRESQKPRNTPAKATTEKLDSNTRLQVRNFQDWVWLSVAFCQGQSQLSYRFIGEDQLTREAIGQLENKSPLQDSSQADNRQSETIKEALEMLKDVEIYTTLHRAAINYQVFKPKPNQEILRTRYGYGRVEITNQNSITGKANQLLIYQIFQLKKGN